MLGRMQGIYVPLSQFRQATCKEVNCKAYLNGWVSTVLEGDNDIGDQWAHIIRHSKMSYTEEKMPDGFTRFTFGPGQICFKGGGGKHRIRKPAARELYYVKDRVQGSIQKFNRACDWVDSAAEHSQMLSDLRQRG